MFPGLSTFNLWRKHYEYGKHSKTSAFLGIIPKKGGGVGIPKLYVKFWWPLFLAMRFTFLFLNLAKIHIFIPKSAYGGSTGLGNIKKNSF